MQKSIKLIGEYVAKAETNRASAIRDYEISQKYLRGLYAELESIQADYANRIKSQEFYMNEAIRGTVDALSDIADYQSALDTLSSK